MEQQNRTGQRAAQSSKTAVRNTTAQTRKPAAKKKRQKMRFHNKNLKYQLLTVAAVVLAVVLCLIVFFRVNRVNVRNKGTTEEEPQATEATEQPQDEIHAYYTAQEVEKASGIEKGDNLLTISKEAVAAKIMAELPYISEVQIRRVLPGTVDITVSEFNVAYAIQATNNAWWLMTRDGKILETTGETEAKTHLTVKGLRAEDPVPAKDLVPEQTEDMAEQNAKKTSLLNILQLMEGYDYCKKIVSIDLTESYDIKLWYGSQFEIHIGNTEELAYKLSYLDGVLRQLKSYQTGVIDLTFTEDKTARFQPFGE